MIELPPETGMLLYALLSVLLIGYAEIHFRIPGIPNRLYRKLPEIIFDLPYRSQHLHDVPLFLFVKDARQFPVTLESAHVWIEDTSNGQLTQQDFALNETVREDFYQQIFWLPAATFQKPGNYHIRANITLIRKKRKLQIWQDSYVGLPKHPFRLYVAADPLPVLPGWRWGDLHVHSNFTDDAVEFGAPVEATAICAKTLGLNFIAITDHSFDLDNHPRDYRRSDPSRSKWGHFLRTCDTHNHHKTDFLVIPGEEVSAGNSRKENVHCLLLGNRQFYPGEGDSGDRILNNTPTLQLTELLQQQAVSDPQAIAAAAHPFDQPPRTHRALLNRGHWHPEDLLNRNIMYWQILNGRRDGFFREGYQAWREALLKGHQIAILAGTDAHGNFNCFRQIRLPFMSMTYHREQLLGQTRTAVFLSEPPSTSAILKALHRKQALVSNGPIGTIELCTAAQTFTIGNSYSGEKGAHLVVRARSTPEFGPLDRIVLFTGNLDDGQESERVLPLGTGTFEFDDTLPLDISPPRGYLRLEITAKKREDETFCLTNPIWIRKGCHPEEKP